MCNFDEFIKNLTLDKSLFLQNEVVKMDNDIKKEWENIYSYVSELKLWFDNKIVIDYDKIKNIICNEFSITNKSVQELCDEKRKLSHIYQNVDTSFDFDKLNKKYVDIDECKKVLNLYSSKEFKECATEFRSRLKLIIKEHSEKIEQLIESLKLQDVTSLSLRTQSTSADWGQYFSKLLDIADEAKKNLKKLRQFLMKLKIFL